MRNNMALNIIVFLQKISKPVATKKPQKAERKLDDFYFYLSTLAFVKIEHQKSAEDNL
jgi:hypothetical protein